MAFIRRDSEHIRNRERPTTQKARLGRMRVPHVELMEPRTLLATLQLSGGLGEQSTLDSVAQTENEMFFLNTPNSQKDPHGDGTAVANVTLTTANSSSGNPGVLLDILSQGSVALHGIANVATSAGLADTDGQIGADLPVTIIPTTPDEQPGDRVIVALSFVYNPKTFASNNAAADFSYLASYTYKGDTTLLVSDDHQAGGPGVTPVGPGNVDHESGTFIARIGDTFTLSFSESLSGHTVAPYLGGLINNVGWVIDTNLDLSASLAPPDPTSTTVTTQPAGNADFGQNVTFTATVADTSSSPDAGTPIGTVQFTVDGTQFGTPVDLDGGTATITDANLPVGSHAISATYTPGNHNFQASSPLAPTPLVIQADSTSTIIGTQPSGEANVGQSVTFTATVANTSQSANPATPTGTVQFSVDGIPYGAPVSLVNGVATTSDAGLPLGSHSISATYIPDNTNFAASDSQPVPLVIQSLIEDSSTLSAVAANGAYGGTATLTASLTSAGLPLLGETVGFSLLVGGIITPVGKSTTNASGVATLNGVSLAGFNVGTFAHFVGASFAGDSTYSGASADGPLTVVENDFLAVTTNPTSQVASAGNPVTFAAAGSGLPTPTMQWQVSTDGGNTFSNLADATSASLTFTTTESENGYEYRAVFTNSAGTAATAPATLTVNTQPGGLVVSAANGVFPQFSLAPSPIASSADSGDFSLVLSTGNILVDELSAVCLFNGKTGALISTLTGGGNVGGGYTFTALTNGNFVVSGVGSATWGSGTTGVSGTVSAANSLVESGSTGSVAYSTAVIPLANGNYVVDFIGWHAATGAVAWGNGTAGTVGTVSAANSLVGNNFGDWVGGSGGSVGGVTALADGNYVVASPFWNNNEGAVTWGNGTTGVAGTITAANSLIGCGDQSGELTVTSLTNGNYVVSNSQWNGGEGEVTWGSGATGVDGTVSAANSLVGSLVGDGVGEDIIALTNGNYVVDSYQWKAAAGASEAGAVTWGSGTMGVSGTISATNSLVGNSGDEVGGWDNASPFTGLVALSNGNYVVASPNWNGNLGAVTWGNGTTGTTGVVSAANCLIGSNQGDSVGAGTPYNSPTNFFTVGVIALSNGNYVVDSPYWNSDEGAATWGNGAIGTIGTVSSANSLVGSHPYSNQTGFSDSVGLQGVTALTNGNYVVDSSNWYGDTGAVTWGNGTTGSVGIVSAANSLVGSDPYDQVGNDGVDADDVIALTNGNYVVGSPLWNDDEGAVTWGSGKTGVVGTISTTNSMVGSSPESLNDSVAGDWLGGGPDGFRGLTALPDGNYAVVSQIALQGAGTVTWGDGTTGTFGTVSSANSFVGADSETSEIVVLPNSNYLYSVSGGGSISCTWFDGSTGKTMDGQITADLQNTFEGTGLPSDIQPISSGSSFIAGSTFAFTDPNELTYALAQGQTITVAPSFLTRDLDAGTDVTIQSNDDITIDSPIDETSSGTPGSLTLEAGRSILINAGINTDGANLSLIANDSVADGVVNSERDPGDADITMASGATLNTGSGTLNVDLEQSTDKTNNDRGSVTLQGVDASALTLPPGSPLAVSINGTTPGDGVAAGTYFQLDVSGSIDLNEAPLQVTANTALAAGTTLTIVQSGSGVTGTFRGLPEGSLIDSASGSVFSISYQADGGNAVVLTALATALTIPSVTGLTPAQGPIAGGTTVTITGTNLASASAVDFGSVQVTSFLSDTADGITLMSPAGSGTMDVTVVTPNGTSATSPADQFSYVAPQPPPDVTGIAPATGPATGGTTVTINGTNLASASAVNFGSVQMTSFLSDTANEITLVSPAGSGTVDVTVVTPNGTSATSPADQFSYVAAPPPPSVTGIAPATGPATGGTTVTINGANLASASAVNFGSVQVSSFLSDTANEITLVSPAGSGPVDVTVVTPNGTSATSPADQFSYVAAPLPASVTGIAPATGPATGGTTVTITGTNLASASAVNFGSVQLTSFLSDTANEITLASPEGSGTVDVTVVTAGGHSPVSPDDTFSYISAVASPTSLSAVSGSGTSGGSATLTSTLTKSGSPLPGRIVTFSLSEGGAVRNVGTAMTDGAGVATLSSVSLAGLAAGTYSGAVLASFAGDSTDAASSAIGTLVVNSKPLLAITGEQPLFLRKTDKKGKPIGRSILSGFVFDFSEPLNPTSAVNSGNYQVDAIITKRVKKQTRRVFQPLRSVAVSYSASADSITLKFTRKQAFPKGGEITVVGGSTSGVTSTSGATLIGNQVFMISPHGHGIIAQ